LSRKDPEPFNQLLHGFLIVWIGKAVGTLTTQRDIECVLVRKVAEGFGAGGTRLCVVADGVSLRLGQFTAHELSQPVGVGTGFCA
jgi:hypothetical protein